MGAASPLDSGYDWDFNLTTEDAKNNIYARYILYHHDSKQIVATIKKFPPGEDFWVKVVSLLPIPFSTLKAAESFITAWFSSGVPPKERTQ